MRSEQLVGYLWASISTVISKRSVTQTNIARQKYSSIEKVEQKFIAKRVITKTVCLAWYQC